MDSLGEAAVATSHRRDAELLIVATLFARIDNPAVETQEGVALANALYVHAEAADARDLFELAMQKPHFRAWYTSSNVERMKQRVLAAIADDSRERTRLAMADVVNVTIEYRTAMALHCLVHKKFNAWLGVLETGAIEPTSEYYEVTLAGCITEVLKDTMKRLVGDVSSGKLTRTAAMELIMQCQVAASSTEYFAEVNELCVTTITGLYEKAVPPPAKRARPNKPATLLDAITQALVYDPDGKLSFHDVWTILRETVPDLVRSEQTQRTPIGMALIEAFGARVRSEEKPRTYAVARRV
jgi:hypothetical protein